MRPAWLPTLPQLAREGLLVAGGVVLGAALLALFPSVRDWAHRQLGKAPE